MVISVTTKMKKSLPIRAQDSAPMEPDVTEIKSITFGVLSAEEIRRDSVCEVDTTKLMGYGSVYDARMGPISDEADKCETCKRKAIDCTGHFGHIELKERIINPQYYKMVFAFLKCFCYSCHRFLLTKSQLELSGILKAKGSVRFKKILKILEKVGYCSHDRCNSTQPKYKYAANESVFSMEFINSEDDGTKTKVTAQLEVEDITRIFENVRDEDLILLGFDPEYVRPKNLIFKTLPVLPPCVRPPISVGGDMSDDDLTTQYISIINHNNALDSKDADARIKSLNNLKFRIATLFDNEKKKAKHTQNNRAIKGMKERICGKEGIIRHNLSGKRANMTARTVIGADPTLRVNEIGIPESIADTLAFPEKVTSFNKDKLQELVNDGGASFLIRDNGKRINLNYRPVQEGNAAHVRGRNSQRSVQDRGEGTDRWNCRRATR